MSVKEIYTMLESSGPCFLKRDVLRYTKASDMSTESLRTFPDVQLLRLEMAHVHVFPHSQRRILQMQKVQRIRLAKRGNWAQISHHIRPQRLPEPF